MAPKFVQKAMIVVSGALAVCVLSSACSPEPTLNVKQSTGSEILSGSAAAQENDDSGTLHVRDVESAPQAETVTIAHSMDLPELEIGAWLSEDVAVVSAINKGLPAYELYGQSQRPRSLYTYNVATAELELLYQEPEAYLDVAQLAPDGKHLTFWDFKPEQGTLHVLDLDTLQATEVGVFTHADWTGNDSIVGYNFHDTGLYTYTLGDPAIVIDDAPPGMVGLMQATKDSLFFSDEAGNTKRFDRGTGSVQALNLGSLGKFELSPDGKQMAFTTHTESGAEELYVCDIDCVKPQFIAEVTGHFEWSPNMQMLAYVKSATSEDGVFVQDFLYDSTQQIIADGYFHSLSWSPDSVHLALGASDSNSEMQGSVLLQLTILNDE